MSEPRDYQVAILTGPSDLDGCALSPLQKEFLDCVSPPEAQIETNFPYRPNSPPYRSMPLLRACFNNACAYLGSRRPNFRSTHALPLCELIERRRRTIFIAGSCGLELLNSLRLPAGVLARVSVFAYGPVARHRPDCHHLLVTGRNDALSRWYFPRPDYWVDASHLSYLRDSGVRSLCREFVRAATA